MVASFLRLLTTLLLALAVAAQPTNVQSSLVKVPFSKHIGSGISNLVKHNQLRVHSLRAKAEGRNVFTPRSETSSSVTNTAVSYVASVCVGSPATQYNLLVDTGSSNTWVGAGKPYNNETSTSRPTDNTVSVTYGSGKFSGTEFIDQVTIAAGLVISNQSIGAATQSSGFKEVDGIIGVGPVALTNNTLFPDTSSTIPTVTDNLFSEGTIPENKLAISFEPITDPSGQQTNGELTWGGTDASRYTGDITFTPITSTSPASSFWGIDASFSYGTTSILSSVAGIVDTGTSLVFLPKDAFQQYQTATGGVLDDVTGLLKINSSQYANLESLFVTVSGVQFELTANAQIWPRALNTALGGPADSIYLIISKNPQITETGLEFVLGQVFLERFYSVFDTANQQVGLATTSFTNATSN